MFSVYNRYTFGSLSEVQQIAAKFFCLFVDHVVCLFVRVNSQQSRIEESKKKG